MQDIQIFDVAQDLHFFSYAFLWAAEMSQCNMYAFLPYFCSAFNKRMHFYVPKRFALAYIIGFFEYFLYFWMVARNRYWCTSFYAFLRVFSKIVSNKYAYLRVSENRVFFLYAVLPAAEA